MRKRPIITVLLCAGLMVALVGVLLLIGRSSDNLSALAPSARVPSEVPAPTLHRTGSAPVKTAESVPQRVCGYADVPGEATDPEAVMRRVGELTKSTADRWVSELQHSGDLRARAAGLYLEGKITGSGSPRPASAENREALAQLVLGAADPAVYRLAISMCDTYAGSVNEGACAKISLRHWAQMDPRNASPWLLLASKARERLDAADEADAFRHAAAASSVDPYIESLYSFAAPELPPDATGLQRAWLATEVSGVEAAMRAPEYGIGQHCAPAAIKDVHIREECLSLAELRVSKATNLLDFMMGRSIGAQAGWSRGRVDALKQQQDAFLQLIAQSLPAVNDEMWTCAGIARTNVYLDMTARLGELGAAEELFERSGETVAELAQTYRQAQETFSVRS